MKKTLLSLRDMEIPYPAAAFMLFPMRIDLERFDGESYVTKAAKGPLNIKKTLN